MDKSAVCHIHSRQWSQIIMIIVIVGVVVVLLSVKLFSNSWMLLTGTLDVALPCCDLRCIGASS